MMDENGQQRHINSFSGVYRQGPREWGSRRSTGNWPSFLKAGCMNVTHILFQGPGCSDTLGSDPWIPHRAFSIVIGILEIAKVKVNTLRIIAFSVASLQPVQGDGDGLGLFTPTRVNAPEGAGVLSCDPPGTSVGNGQFAISRRFGRKEQTRSPGWMVFLSFPYRRAMRWRVRGELDLDELVSL